MGKIVMKVLPDPPDDNTVQPATLKAIEGLDEPLDYGFGPSLRFVFTLTDPAYEGLEATTITNLMLKQRSKALRIVTGVLGRAPNKGEDFAEELASAVGQPFRVTVQHKDSRDGSEVFLEAAEVAPA